MNKHLPLQSGRLIVWRKALMRTLLFQLLLLTAIAQSSSAPALVAGVEAIGMTVSDVDRSVEFFQQILSFEKVSDIEVLVLT